MIGKGRQCGAWFSLFVLAHAACDHPPPPPPDHRLPPLPQSETPPWESIPLPAATVAESDAAQTVPHAEPRFAFHITAVYAHEHPTNTKPWHAPGGAFTFFDGALKDAKLASFTIGVHMADDTGVGDFGDAVIQATEPARGAEFLEALAKAFGAKTPGRQSKKLSPFLWPLPFMIRGRNLASVNAPIGGQPPDGGWISGKWFIPQLPPNDAIGIEIYVDCNVDTQEGEITVRDEAEVDAILATFAIWLRDGGAPKLTKEPNGTP